MRWRLKTGLDQLRQWSAEEDGEGWRRALLPLTGTTAVVAPAAPVPPGTTLGGTAGKVGAVAAGLAVVALLVLGTSARLREPPPVRGVSAVPEEPGAIARAGAPAVAPGGLTGEVLGPDGTPAAAVVVLTDGAGQERGTQATGEDGRFAFEALPPGAYTVQAASGSFLPGRLTANLRSGQTASLQLRLVQGGGLLRGRVLDAGAGVIPFARVRADGSGVATLADAEGRFALRLPLGPQGVTASADGYARHGSHVELAGDQTLDFFLQPAAAFEGQVLDADSGEPVAGAFVEAQMINGHLRRWDRSAAEGHFRVGGLEPGQYRVFARKGTRVGFASAPVVLTNGAREQGVIVRLRPSFSISGRVLDPRGEPQPGARVGVEEARGGSLGFHNKEVKATTDPLGRYRIDGLVAGVYHLSAHAPPFGDAEAVTVGLDRSDRQAADLQLGAAARVSGRVLAADGMPVAGAAVELEVRADDDHRGFVRGRRTLRSDAEGRFTAADLGAGWLTATARGARGESATRTLELTPAAAKEVELTFAKPGFIEGRVRWADGSPAAGVLVIWHDNDRHALTDAAGHYRLGPLAPGAGIIHAERPGTTGHTGSMDLEASERRLQVHPGTTTGCEDLVLERGDRSIAGVVLDPDGAPLAGATLSASPSDQTPDRSFTQTEISSGPDGAFSIPSLTRGTHLVRARDPRFPDVELTAAGGDRHVRVRFVAPSTVTGTLVDPAGRPVPVATVRVVPSERLDRRRLSFGREKGTRRRVEDSGGVFSVSPLAAGIYDLLVTSPAGGAGRVAEIALRPGQTLDGLRVVVAPDLTVVGRVLAHGSDQPIAGATIGIADDGPHFETRTDAQGQFRLERQVPGRTIYLQVDGSGAYSSETWAVVLAATGPRQILPTIRLVRPTGVPRFPPGIRFSTEIGPLRAQEVAPGSIFDRAGVRPGDALRAIAGRDAAGLGVMGLSLVLVELGGTAELLFVARDGGERRATITLPPP